MRNSAQNHLAALGGLAVAILLRWLVDPLLGDTFPFTTLFGAVAAAVWIGGLSPGVFAALLGYVTCSYLLVPPRGTLLHGDAASLVSFVAYAVTCSVIIAFGVAMRSAQSRASERRELLRVTLRSIGDAVITTDVDGRVASLNAVAESLTGWPQREAIGVPLEDVFRIVNEDTRDPVRNPAIRALQEGITVGLANHTLLLSRDGTERPIDDSAAPIKDENGHISGCVLIFRDVTRQRGLEKECAEQLLSARLLASIVESSDDAIVSKSLDGIVESWNAAAVRLFGYEPEEAVGRHISLVIPPERLSEEDVIIASLKAGKSVDHFETVRLRKDGRRILVSLTVSPVKDDAGHVIGASKIVRDVTRQREAEERERHLLAETAAANAKFQAFFEQGALFAAILEVDGTILEANRLSWEGCGFTREQIVGMKFCDGPWFSPSATLVEEIRAGSALAASGETFRKEVPYFFGDGSEHLADVTIQPIRDGSGRVLFLAPTGVDITERKRAEADRGRLAADLSESNRRKDEFLAMLAHELRNPLAPMSNAVHVLQRAGSGDTVRAASAMLERQVGQMSRLVDDLLDMSRITQGKIELRRERIELSPILSQAVEAARPLYSSMGHDLTLTVPQRPLMVHADATRIAQVVGNLLNNAAKFTNKGGHVSLTAERDGTDAVLRVRDSGIGIASTHLGHVFDMFTQVDTSLERTRGGLGIGLTLVRRLIGMHGGSVEATSPGLDLGSEFVVRIPLLAEDVTNESPSPSPDPVRRARRVLIVDDNRDGAESLAMLLKLEGHETHTAHDGLEALEAAGRLQPEIVLLDIGLPNLNGYEVCRRLRQEPWGKSMGLIALTGWGQPDDRRKSAEAGFDSHLVKPVDHVALAKLIADSRAPEAFPGPEGRTDSR